MTNTVVLDVDGTLVDTNYQHALAWFRAFRRYEITVPIWQLHRAIGMGGDRLVTKVAGQDAEDRHGNDLRAAWEEEYQPMLAEVTVLAGAHELLADIKQRGFSLVLASSGKPEQIDHYLDLLDARKLADAWTTSEDVATTKPAPDLLEVALNTVEGTAAVTIGDSVWDCTAAQRLDIACLGVRTGGFATAELIEAGALHVYDDLDSLRKDLDRLPWKAVARP